MTLFHPNHAAATYIRNFIFGVEDSLVSTVGLLSGVAIAQTPRETILLTGVVLIFVEAFSMAVGSFLSESSTEAYLVKGQPVSNTPMLAGVIMFFSYFVSGFLPLAPYILLEPKVAFWVSILASLLALFILGTIGAGFSKTNRARGGLKMAIVGGIALGIGVLVGKLLSS
jgi:VIT1/CCC1 family predicted Fe2+/Mn2+ transporter